MEKNSMLTALRRKWVAYRVLSDIMIAAGAAFFLSILFYKLMGWPEWWSVLYFIIIFTVLFLVHGVWTIDEVVVARWLDQHYPQLEESSSLLIKPLPQLGFLERLQYRKTGASLASIEQPLRLSGKIIQPVLILVVLLAGGIALNSYRPANKKDPASVQSRPGRTALLPEKKLPQVAAVTVSIHPPAYTGKTSRQQQAFNVMAEEGALIQWKLQTNLPAAEVVFIFNDHTKKILHAADNGHTQWTFEKKVDSTGFYQLSIDGKISTLYKLETIPDRPPVVTMQSPKQYTTIDYGEPQQVKLGMVITDDYSVRDAFVAATIASGNGEAVKFKEQKIPMVGFIEGKAQYQLQQPLLLNKLGMQPGDELYFYVQATDSRQQATRSDIYIIHLPDTAQLMSMDGLVNSLTLKPEYFRSQRQIIIETEQLLKEKDTISQEAFRTRSNNLGIDQKLLRLRYGKFLGDEAESGESNINELGAIADFSNAEKIRDAYTDKHDNAEDATFYEPETKKQLRATLTEMWNAEMPLRTFAPQTALPFEYKALRLLKDLQQKSRAYVAKTNLKTTPLDLKKRLTGDLSKIDNVVMQKDIPLPADEELPVRQALAVLESMKATGHGSPADLKTLTAANLYLQKNAIRQPDIYLQAVSAMKEIMDSLQDSVSLPANDILTAVHGLQQLLSQPLHLPSAAVGLSKKTLAKQYFDNLQKKLP